MSLRLGLDPLSPHSPTVASGTPVGGHVSPSPARSPQKGPDTHATPFGTVEDHSCHRRTDQLKDRIAWLEGETSRQANLLAEQADEIARLRAEGVRLAKSVNVALKALPAGWITGIQDALNQWHNDGES